MQIVKEPTIKAHLLQMSKTELANDYAFIFSCDLDRVEARIQEQEQYIQHVDSLTKKVFNNQIYLNTIGLKH